VQLLPRLRSLEGSVPAVEAATQITACSNYVVLHSAETETGMCGFESFVVFHSVGTEDTESNTGSGFEPFFTNAVVSLVGSEQRIPIKILCSLDEIKSLNIFRVLTFSTKFGSCNHGPRNM